jgi:hypothetical protein
VTQLLMHEPHQNEPENAEIGQDREDIAKDLSVALGRAGRFFEILHLMLLSRFRITLPG